MAGVLLLAGSLKAEIQRGDWTVADFSDADAWMLAVTPQSPKP